MLRILFTGGVTGGHIYPILAVAEELKLLQKTTKIEIDLRYLGVPDRYSDLLEKNGIKVSKILSAKWRRYFDLRNFLDIPKFFLSFFQVLWKIFWPMPDVLFSKGGPGALPVVLICKLICVPVIIHDSDAVPGLVSRISDRLADRVGISFSSAAAFFKNKNIALVGNPVRHSLLEKKSDKADAKKKFGFNPDRPLILVIGGSQGAVKINSFFLDIARELIKSYSIESGHLGWQILYQTGIKNFEEFKKELNVVLKNLNNEEKDKYKIFPYFEKEMADAYSAADLIISRSGSGSIFEIAAFAKPSVLIPLSVEVAADQVDNAYEYAKSGAAVVVEEENLKPNIFLNQLKKLLTDQEKLEAMSEAAGNFSKPEAARIIAEEILNLTKVY